MKEETQDYIGTKTSKRLLIILPFLWTFIVFISLIWNIYQTKHNTISIVTHQAEGLFQLIETTRLWNANHGGVLVPITNTTKPNPYLDIPDRDITTVTGKHYTKINPAYMTRQIAEIAKNRQNILFHITSLKPIRPENRADLWEAASLMEFEKGNTEKIELTGKDSEKVFRYMAPLFINKACLKCHAKHGYGTGDIYGGISVSIPAEPILSSLNVQILSLSAFHLVIFIIGLGGLLFFSTRLKRQWTVLEVTNKALCEKSVELQKLSMAVEQSLTMVVLTDIKGKIEYVNSSFTKITGHRAEEIIGKNLSFLRLYILSEKEYNGIWETVNSGHVWHREFQNRKKNGDLFWVSASISPLIDSEGVLTHFLEVSEDITRRKIAEDALREKTSYMESILRSAPNMAIAATDLDFRIIYYNPVAEQLFGYRAEEVIGKTVMEMHTKENVEPSRFEKAIEAVKKEGKYTYTVMQNQEGKIRFIDNQVTGIYNEKRNMAGFLFMARNVTAKRFAQQQAEVRAQVSQVLQEDRSLHSKLNEALEHIIKMKGLNIMNKGGIFLREPGSDFIKMYLTQGDFSKEFNQMDKYVPLGKCLCGRVALSGELLISDDCFCDPRHELKYEGMTPHGHYIIPLSYSGETLGVLFLYTKPYPPREPSFIELLSFFGKIMGMAISNDRTNKQLRQSNEQIRIAMDEISLANRTKSEFLANMSHEFRTPLNIILGYTQILKKDKSITKLQKEGLHTIEKSGNHLLNLISDILDMSKIETKKMEIHKSIFNFTEFLMDIVEMMWVQTHQKKISFHYETPFELPRTVWGDTKRLNQVLLNLLNNAVKFTNKGSVTLQVKAIHKKHNSQNSLPIRFYVKDTGIGIAKEQLKEIFSPFKQIGRQSQKNEGTGLGLAISQNLVRLMGGELYIKSTVGKGTTLWFEIDLPEVTEEVVIPSVRKQKNIIGFEGKKRKILIVDDIVENRTFLKDVLLPLKFEIREAVSGNDAIEKGIEFHPDLILMDIVMPGMNGLESIKQIREIPALKDVIVIAVSADAFDKTRQECIEAGCNYFLAKPVQVDTLLERLQFSLGLQWSYEDSSKIAEDEQVFDTTHLLTPPQKDIEVLLKLANMRNFTGIQDDISRIKEMNPHYLPFITIIEQLLKKYQFLEIIDFLNSYLKETEM